MAATAPAVDEAGPAPVSSFSTESPSSAKRRSFIQTLRHIHWTWDILAISIVYMVEGFTDLAGVAVQYYFKDALGLSPAAAGYAYTVCMLPWNITPVLGLLTDSVPLFGYHRKAYLVMVGCMGSLSWLALPHTHHIVPVTMLVFVSNLCSAWSQVVADAVTVKLSQRQEMEVAAVFQSLSWITYTVGAILGGFVTGKLLEKGGPKGAFLLMSAFMLVDCLCGLLISEHRGSEARQPRRQRTGTQLGDPEEQALLPGLSHPSSPSALARVALLPVVTLLQRLWDTLKQPHILGAALFIFVWQATPAPTSAMFFFQTNALGFSPSLMELIYLCGSMSGFLGVLIYNTLLVHRSLRGTLLWAAIIGSVLNASQLLLVSRLNLKLHLSDELFSLGDYSMLSVIAEVMLTPMLAMAARMCPDGIEATLSATLYSLLNMSRAVSSASGAALTSAFQVTESDFSGLFGLTLVCNLMMLVPLPLLLMVPPGSGATLQPLHPGDPTPHIHVHPPLPPTFYVGSLHEGSSGTITPRTPSTIALMGGGQSRKSTEDGSAGQDQTAHV